MSLLIFEQIGSGNVLFKCTFRAERDSTFIDETHTIHWHTEYNNWCVKIKNNITDIHEIWDGDNWRFESFCEAANKICERTGKQLGITGFSYAVGFSESPEQREEVIKFCKQKGIPHMPAVSIAGHDHKHNPELDGYNNNFEKINVNYNKDKDNG